MTDATLARLERIKNYSTRYELVLTNGIDSYLIVYSANRSRRIVFDYVRKYGEAIVHLTGAAEFKFGKKAADGATLGNGWEIKWSGRTQREAILSMELPFIGNAIDVPAVA